MGSCLTGMEKQQPITSCFYEDVQLDNKLEIYKPVNTSFYNVLRKPNNFIVVQPSISTKASLLPNTLKNQIQDIQGKDFKTLFNFKKVVVLGDYEKQKKKVYHLAKEASISKLYVVSESDCVSFLKTFPLFLQRNSSLVQPAPARVPILVFDSSQLVKQCSPKRIFLHQLQLQSNQIYTQLGLTGQSIIQPTTNNDQTESAYNYYLQALKRNSCLAVVLLHTRQFTQTNLLELLSSYLVQMYQVNSLSAKVYLQRYLPNATITGANLSVLLTSPEVFIPQHQRYKELLLKLNSQLNSQKTQRSYNLLQRLLANIYQNPGNQQSYRQIKRNNRQMEEVSQSTSGRKLLDELGFIEQGLYWVNNTDSKYLKIFKTDFDLAFRNYQLELLKQ